MRALSLTQPWATLVILGAKRLETRGWSTEYRGPLAIQAAKGFPRWAQETCLEEPFRSVLWPDQAPEPRNLPRGLVLGTVHLADCLSTNLLCRQYHAGDQAAQALLAGHERDFGDYSEDRFAWVLRDPRPFEIPIAARGALGLWEWGEVKL